MTKQALFQIFKQALPDHETQDRFQNRYTSRCSCCKPNMENEDEEEEEESDFVLHARSKPFCSVLIESKYNG